MTGHTITLYLTDEQQRQLEALTEALNRQRETPTDPAGVLSMVMNSGTAYIDERLKMWNDQTAKGGPRP